MINYYQDESSRRFRPSQFKNPDKRPRIEAALRGVLITWYIYRVTYNIALLFAKLSILFFYRAIASQATFRRLVHSTMALITLYTLAASLASIFQCAPISDAWSIAAFLSQFDGVPGRAEKPKCYDPSTLWLVSAAVNLFSDVVIMLLPIPALLSLNVPVSKRLALVAIFSIGIMAVVASCVRMWVMALWAESPQNSINFGTDLLLWGQIETNAGIIAASVPFLRMLFRCSGCRVSGVAGQRQREKGVAAPRVVVGETGNGKAVEIDSVAFFEGHGEKAGGPDLSMAWNPFITVPESLGSESVTQVSRGSGLIETKQTHLTV